MEFMMTFVKSLPHWLGTITEVMIVTVVFLTCMTFLAGIWCGLKVIGKRSNSIQQIEFFPPKIVFKGELNK